MRHGKCFKYAKLAIFADQKAAFDAKGKDQVDSETTEGIG
jgi:hypothetical protein